MPLEENKHALRPQTNVVLMGQGEPLLNYDPVMAALRIILDPEAIAISPRHVTLSSSGIVPGIERLAQEKVRPKLAVSLNATTRNGNPARLSHHAHINKRHIPSPICSPRADGNIKRFALSRTLPSNT